MDKRNLTTETISLKKIIKELESEIYRLNEIIKHLPGDIYWKNKDGVYLGINERGINSLKKMGFKWKSSNIIGKTDFDLYDKQTACNFRKNDLEIMEAGFEVSKEEVASLPSGEKIIQISTKKPIFDQGGNVCGIVGNTTDVTYLKNIEKNLKESKEKAEAASKAKSEFIANMSHDIRTPITGVVGMVQDLLNTAHDTDSSLKKNKNLPNGELFKITKSLTKHIENDSNILMSSVDQLLQLLDEILEVSRLDHGLIQKKSESFNVYDLIQASTELLTPVAKNKKLKLIAEISKNVPKYVTGLREYINRTLLNLLSNALKFTKKGRVKIKVDAISKGKKNYKIGDKCNLQIIVEDTGIGIPEDKFETIFEHFSRLNPAYEGIYQGSGLGLYTVKHYIEAMRGNIAVKSELAKGTTFIVTVPFTVADKVNEKNIPPKQDKKKIESRKKIDLCKSFDVSEKIESPTCDVLIVEDNIPAAMAIKIVLKTFKCAMDIAESGKQAIKKAKNKKYDLILMDVGLPDIDGIEVTKKIRAFEDKVKSKVPIIALTGHAYNPEMRQQCLKAGMQDVLCKPAQPLTLEPIFKQYVFGTKQKSKKNTVVDSKPKTSSEQTIDLEGCAHMYGNDEAAAINMLGMLYEDVDNTLSTLEKCYKEKDIQGLRSELHRTLGGVVYVRVPKLEKAIKDFQTVIKTEPSNFKEWKHTYKNVKEAISDFKKEFKKLKSNN